MSTFSAKQCFALGIAIIMGLAGLVAHPSTSHADEGWVISHFDSALTIQESGVVRIVETISVDFAELEKHGIYRDIPYRYTDEQGEEIYTDVTVTEVLIDGEEAPYDTTRTDGYVQLKIGDADEVISGAHTYRITYDATGILSAYEDYDELYWNVTGNGWGVPILTSSASITLPREGIQTISCYVGEYGEPGVCTQASNQHSNTGNIRTRK